MAETILKPISLDQSCQNRENFGSFLNEHCGLVRPDEKASFDDKRAAIAESLTEGNKADFVKQIHGQDLGLTEPILASSNQFPELREELYRRTNASFQNIVGNESRNFFYRAARPVDRNWMKLLDRGFENMLRMLFTFMELIIDANKDQRDAIKTLDQLQQFKEKVIRSLKNSLETLDEFAKLSMPLFFKFLNWNDINPRDVGPMNSYEFKKEQFDYDQNSETLKMAPDFLMKFIDEIIREPSADIGGVKFDLFSFPARSCLAFNMKTPKVELEDGKVIEESNIYRQSIDWSIRIIEKHFMNNPSQ